MNLADTALDEFVSVEGPLLRSVTAVAKSIDRALVKMGSPSFYIAFQMVTHSRGDVVRAATGLAAYALDPNSVSTLNAVTANLIQSMRGFLNQVCGGIEWRFGSPSFVRSRVGPRRSP